MIPWLCDNCSTINQHSSERCLSCGFYRCTLRADPPASPFTKASEAVLEQRARRRAAIALARENMTKGLRLRRSLS